MTHTDYTKLMLNIEDKNIYINNVIKQIKHTACGYKKFTHLKARVMLIKGLYNPIKA